MVRWFVPLTRTTPPDHPPHDHLNRSAGSAITEEYNIEAANTGDVDISSATIVDYMGWVFSKSLAGETAQIIINNVTSNISLTNANAMYTKAAGSTTYPSGTGTDIGEITSTSLTTVSLYECGIQFVYIPGVAVTPTIATYNLSLIGAGT